MRHLSIVIFVLSSALATPAFSDESKSGQEGPLWFRHFGVGFRASASFQSVASNNGDFPVGYVLGPEIVISAFSLDYHSVILGLGYHHFGRSPEKGSYEIAVKTRYDRLDFWAGYDFNWELLVAGARVGAALMVIGTETSYGKPTWEIADIDGDGENDLIFTRDDDPDIRTRSGVLGIGFSLGKYMFNRPGIIEIRAQSDYVRRGTRNEFTVGGLLVFWPTKLFAKKGQ